MSSDRGRDPGLLFTSPASVSIAVPALPREKGIHVPLLPWSSREYPFSKGPSVTVSLILPFPRSASHVGIAQATTTGISGTLKPLYQLSLIFTRAPPSYLSNLPPALTLDPDYPQDTLAAEGLTEL